MNAGNDAPWPPWHVRAGGRWIVSWQEFAISGPLALISVVAFNPSDITDANDVLRWLVVAVMALAVVGAWVLLNHWTILRRSRTRPVPVSLVIGGAFVTGAIFGATVSFGVIVLGLQSDRSPILRILITGVFVAWWGVAISLILDARERLRLMRISAVQDALALEGARLREGEIVDDLRAQVAATVDVTLNRSRDRLERAITQQGDLLTVVGWPRIAQELRTTAADSIRPLSRELWNAAQGDDHRSRAWMLLPFIVSQQPFRPLVVTMLYLLSSGLQIMNQAGLAVGAQIVGIALGLILIIMLSANAVMRRFPNHHAAIFVGALVLLQCGVLIDNPVREHLGAPLVPVEQQVAGVVLGIALVLATSAFGAFRKMDLEAIATVRRDIDVDLIVSLARSQRLAEVLWQAGVALHGSVQGRLLASAAAVEQAARSSDAVQFGAAIAQARHVLTAAWINPEADETLGDLGSIVEHKCALWSGLCVVRIVIDDAARAVQGPSATQAGHVVEEAVANAVRHGQATCVDVWIQHLPNAIRITVTDDGNGTGIALAGMGTALFASVSKGAWSIQERPDGAGVVVTVELADRGATLGN